MPLHSFLRFRCKCPVFYKLARVISFYAGIAANCTSLDGFTKSNNHVQSMLLFPCIASQYANWYSIVDYYCIISPMPCSYFFTTSYRKFKSIRHFEPQHRLATATMNNASSTKGQSRRLNFLVIKMSIFFFK